MQFMVTKDTETVFDTITIKTSYLSRLDTGIQGNVYILKIRKRSSLAKPLSKGVTNNITVIFTYFPTRHIKLQIKK